MNQLKKIKELFWYIEIKTKAIISNSFVSSLFSTLTQALRNQILIYLLIVVFSAFLTFPSIGSNTINGALDALGEPDNGHSRHASSLAVPELPHNNSTSFISQSSPPSITLQPIATGLNKPLAIVSPGDGSGRLFIAQQGGKILVYDGTRVLSTPFLDISSLVTCCGEQGLLGLAFHPDYVNNGLFYIDYTDINGDTVVARYSVSTQADIADPNSVVTVLTVFQPFVNQNGGHLAFGPDGYLYVSMGDGGGDGDPNNNAQNLGTLLGKILRIDADGDDFPNNPNRNYAIPHDNPFVGGAGVRGAIWVYGLRNPRASASID
jgi:glucose/arabinose dehydrogenase